MRIPVRKILRVAGWTIGGILVLLCLAVGGLFAWLRTDHAERTIAGLATDALKDQGLFLSVDSLSGPLPSRLLLTNVRLADASGQWFAARELEVELRLLDLLGGTATVSLARIDTPKVYRLPVLPPSPPALQPEPKTGSSPGYFSLPVSVKLEKLSIDNCGIYPGLVFPPASSETASASAQADASSQSPLFLVAVQGEARGEAGQPLEAKTSIRASVADMPALAAALGAGSLPVSGFSLATDVTASVGMMIEAGLTGTATPEAEGKAYPVSLGLQARLAGETAALRSASVEGIGLRLDAKGGADLNTLAAQADITFTADAGGEWEPLLARISGQAIGGSLNTALRASVESGGAVAAALDLSASGMRWGMTQLDGLIGRNVTLKADVTGGGLDPYTLTLAALNAGKVTASGSARYAPGNRSVEAALSAALSDISPLAPDVSGALSAKADVFGTLDAPAVTLNVTSNAITSPAASLEKIRLAASLTGTLAAPVFSLTAASDAIRTQAGAFGQFRAAVDGNAQLPQTGNKTAQAKADVSIASSPAGPVALHSAAAFTQTPSGAITARLFDLGLTLAGADLKGDITAGIPASGGANPVPSLEGTASVSITDWKPLAALSGVPITGGKAGFDAKFSHDADVQRISATIAAQSLTLPDAFSLSGLDGKLEARDLANPDIALTLAMGKGGAGPVNWQTGALAVRATGGNGTFAAALRSDNSASGSLKTLTRGAPAHPGGTERLSAAGTFSLSPMRVEIDRLAARLPDSPLGVYLPSPAAVTLGDKVAVENLTVNVVPGKGAVALNVAIDPVNADLRATVTELPFRLAREAAGVPVPDGTLSAEAAITKKGVAVQGNVNAKAVMYPSAAGKKKPQPVVFALASTLDRDADPNFPNLRSGGGISRLKGGATVGFDSGQASAANAPDARINFNIPLRFAASGLPEPAMTAPLGATVAWSGDIAPLWALTPMPDRSLSGVSRINAELKGTLEKPDYSVNAYVAGGRYEDFILGVLLTDIMLQANATLTESTLVMRAEDGQGGYVAVEGALTQPRSSGDGAPAVPGIRARGQINHLQPLHRDDVSLRLSGRLSIEGPLDSMNIKADTEIERGQISIANIAGGVRTLPVHDPAKQEKPAGSGPMLDINVNIPHRFYIRGRGLDSEWEGKLAVKGFASGPELTGSLRPVRGYFDLLSRNFEFTKGDITFFGGDRIDPALNLALTYEATNITAIVRAQGTASKPDIVMESQPSLPQDQIMSEVLFGKDFSKLSRFEALQVANGVRQLANIGGDGLDPLATMRTTLGIDMLRVGSSETGANSDNRSISGAPGASTVTGGNSSSSTNGSEATPTLEAGKYINDAIYIGVEQGATAESTGVRVEVELRPNLNLQGKTTSRSSEVGLGWKRDY